mgnify:CR=1 FL=1
MTAIGAHPNTSEKAVFSFCGPGPAVILRTVSNEASRIKFTRYESIMTRRQTLLLPLFSLLLGPLFLIGCGGNGDSSIDVSTEVATYAIETPDEFKVAPGADPSVSAEAGGEGFAEIAEAQGWETGGITEEQLPLIGSLDAVKGGELKFAVTDFPATFRAYGKDENSAVTRMIHNQVYEGLVTINPLTLEFLPILASHWKVGEDGQTFWFRIDPDARFSDGHPVTTDDVIATYKLATDEGILSPYTNTFYGGFETPVAESKYIFKVRAKELGWKNLLYFGGTSILPAHVIGELSGSEYLEKYQYDMPPGSGPYVVQKKDIQNGKVMSLTRRTNYWGMKDPTYKVANNFDKITMLVVRDEALQRNMLRQGEIDLYLVPSALVFFEELEREETKRGLTQMRRIFNDSPQGFNGLAFNMRKPPFDDIRVRKAFGYLFDREGLDYGLMFGRARKIDSYYPGSVYEHPNNPKVRYDPDEGLALLAEAGYVAQNAEGILVHEKTGAPLSIEVPVTRASMEIMETTEQLWREYGIDLQLEEVDGPTQFKMVNERNFSMSFQSWGASLFPNPKSSFHSELADVPNTNNLSGYKNDRVDELIAQELVEFDQERRIEILQEIDGLLMESGQYALAWYGPFTRIGFWNKFGYPDYMLGKVSDWRYIMSYWWVSPEKNAALSEAVKSGGDLGEGERDVRVWPEYNEKNGGASASAGDDAADADEAADDAAEEDAEEATIE